MADYVQAARKNPPSEWQRLWLEYAVEPYWSEWAEGQFNEARIRKHISIPFTNLDGLEAEIELLKRSGIEQVVQAAFDAMTQKLPPCVPQHVVCIYAEDPDNAWVREHGVVGEGVGENILLRLSPLGEDWLRLVPYVLAHEYHHAIWGNHYFGVLGKTSMDLLTGLMIDGEADSFASMLYPEMQPSWIHALTPEEESVQWARMQEYLPGNDGAVYERFFFGDPATGTPGGTAYTIGYHIVQAYLHQHPEQSVMDLMNKEAQEILAESGYAP
ncbi:MAG: hypothetical protein HY835_05675 [Anaerolineae bacterium]|nr:hypothetical protein [Anaerolineae bacterium]